MKLGHIQRIGLVLDAPLAELVELRRREGRRPRCQAVAAKMLLVAIANHAGTEDAICYATRELLERETAASSTTIGRAVAVLEAEKLLEVERRSTAKGRPSDDRRSNVYRLRLDVLDALGVVAAGLRIYLVAGDLERARLLASSAGCAKRAEVDSTCAAEVDRGGSGGRSEGSGGRFDLSLKEEHEENMKRTGAEVGLTSAQALAATESAPVNPTSAPGCGGRRGEAEAERETITITEAYADAALAKLSEDELSGLRERALADFSIPYVAKLSERGVVTLLRRQVIDEAQARRDA